MSRFISVCLLIIFVSCEKQNLDNPFPVLVTLSVSNIDLSGAKFNGRIKTPGSSSIVNYGFVWDTKPKPTLKQGHYVSVGQSYSDNIFEISIKKDLLADTQYNVRTFAQTKDLVIYGNEVVFFSKGSESYSWEEVPQFDTISRIGAVSFCIDNFIYVGLGYQADYTFQDLNDDLFLNDFWKYNYEENKWIRIADFPSEGRINAVGFAINGKGYVGTGYGLEGNKKDFWEYNPSENNWIRKADFPSKERSGCIGFSANGKGYIGLGGYANGFDFEFKYDYGYSDIWEYIPESDIWSKKNDFTGGTYVKGTCVVVNDMAYIGFGKYFGYDMPSSGTYSSDFWIYNILNDAWLKSNSFPSIPRNGAVGFSLNDKVYMGTGHIGDRSGIKNFNDFWEYNPVQQQWTRKPDLIGNPRTLAVGFSINNSGYVGLGSDSNDQIIKYLP